MDKQKNIDDLLKNIDNINLEDLEFEETMQKAEDIAGSFKDDGRSDSNSIFGGEIREEHKIVSQLDDVTRETEQKATEVFDVMNDMSNDLMWMLDKISSMSKVQSNVVERLKAEKNPSDVVKSVVIDIENGLLELEEMLGITNHANHILLEAMSLMQYQDIGRQKIERVINIMRSLIKYLNILFEGKRDDTSRTSSAKHLAGDGHVGTSVVSSQTELEDLISLYKSK